jgi:hypothetical protein
MGFVLENTKQCSLAEIDAFEGRSSLRLPADYKRFLQTTNGGRQRSGGVIREFASQRKVSRVNLIFGLREESSYNIETHMSYLDSRIPEKLLPIAYDSGGNYVLLDCNESRGGRVYFMGLELADPDVPPSLDSLILVANSFDDFMERLEADR